MNTEFSIFRVKKGKEERAEEWMRQITARRAECIDTLDREAMYYESVFKSMFEDRMYLAWYSVQGDVHGEVDESEHEIDKLHCAFWNECLDFDWRPVDMEHVVSFAPKSVDNEISKIDQLNQQAKKESGKIEKR